MGYRHKWSFVVCEFWNAICTSSRTTSQTPLEQWSPTSVFLVISKVDSEQDKRRSPICSKRMQLYHFTTDTKSNSLKVCIKSVSNVLRAHSRFVKCIGDSNSACGLSPPPPIFYKPTMGPKYVSNRPYNLENDKDSKQNRESIEGCSKSLVR